MLTIQFTFKTFDTEPGTNNKRHTVSKCLITLRIYVLTVYPLCFISKAFTDFIHLICMGDLFQYQLMGNWKMRRNVNFHPCFVSRKYLVMIESGFIT